MRITCLSWMGFQWQGAVFSGRHGIVIAVHLRDVVVGRAVDALVAVDRCGATKVMRRLRVRNPSD
jgi:hypothetical protein